MLVALAAGAERAQLVSWLVRQGHSVTLAADRRGVVRRLRERRVDLVLLGVGLCIDDPTAMCDGIRTSGARPPIVALIGDGSHLVAGLDAGASDYLNEPLVEAGTVARVGALLRTQATIDALSAQAATDNLTGLWNRCQLDDRARELVASAERSGAPMSCLMIDLDHFKSVNDTYGHLAGDRVLRVCAERALAEVRTGDVLFRYGGEEFLLLMPGADLDAARVLSERVVAVIGALPVPIQDLNGAPVALQVTASIGGAVLQHGMAAVDLIGRADTALLAAKSLGRNRAVMADDEVGRTVSEAASGTD